MMTHFFGDAVGYFMAYSRFGGIDPMTVRRIGKAFTVMTAVTRENTVLALPEGAQPRLAH